MIIAVDGPAGVGKSSLARRIADEKGFFNLNSGSFYRAVSLKVLDSGIPPDNPEAVVRAAESARLELKGGRLTLDGTDIEERLGGEEVGRLASVVSSLPAVRHAVNRHLRRIAGTMNLVAEGRDITTVVFPEAELKIYLDAEPRVRALRRFRQGAGGADIGEIEASIRERDHRDRNKPEGALKKAEDAVVLDTSALTLDEVYAKVIGLLNTCLGENMPESDAFAQESSQNQLQEVYLKALDQLEEGGIIEGEVIQVDGEFVYLDVGLKSDGKVPVGEFSELPSVGERVETVLVKREGRSGEVVISKKKADMKVFWKTLRDAFENNEPISGTVSKAVKGGFEVELGFDMRAFCPISKMDIQRIDDPSEYIDMESLFLIDRLYSEKKVNIVLTRRLWLERRGEVNRDKFFQAVSIGDEVEGAVKSFTSFGAFVDLGGFDGLLHINDMSWGHVTRPKDYVKKGEQIKLKVIRLDSEEKKINLSLKHFYDDPWSTFEEKYHVDQVIKGRVTKLTDFGAFIEIEEGIEGLAHISELSWLKRVKHPRELFSIGDECEAMILGYDIPQGRISLGLKQVLPNPWEEIEVKYPVGTRGEWLVKKITNAGAFVELEEGIDAFLHADDLSWTKKIRNVSSVLSEGETVAAVVTSVNASDRRIRLGLKQLEGDPWIDFHGKYPRGSVVSGEITGKTEFGIFVKVEGDIEGLIHKNNLTETKEEDSEAKLASLNVGDTIKASVIEVNTSKRKLSLSVREMKYREERAEISKYMDGEEESDDSYTLADMLKDKQD